MSGRWRQQFAPVIHEVLQKYPDDTKERRRAFVEAFNQFGLPRYNWPYHVWCDERKRQIQAGSFIGELLKRYEERTPYDGT